MAVLSTGAAAAVFQANPTYVAFQPGFATGTQSAAPVDWLAANGGAIPVAPGCPSAAGTTAVDPILLSLRIRVPTNANSLRFSARVLASDYPEWVCSNFNDVFVALLDSGYAGTPPNPPDRNLARYTASPGQVYPLGVNLAAGNTGLFTQCRNGNIGCENRGSGCTFRWPAECGHLKVHPDSGFTASGGRTSRSTRLPAWSRGDAATA